jgi:hypothetical protein
MVVALLYIQQKLKIDYLSLSIEANQFRDLQKIKLQKRSLSKYSDVWFSTPYSEDYCNLLQIKRIKQLEKKV